MTLEEPGCYENRVKSNQGSHLERKTKTSRIRMQNYEDQEEKAVQRPRGRVTKLSGGIAGVIWGRLRSCCPSKVPIYGV